VVARARARVCVCVCVCVTKGRRTWCDVFFFRIVTIKSVALFKICARDDCGTEKEEQKGKKDAEAGMSEMQKRESKKKTVFFHRSRQRHSLSTPNRPPARLLVPFLRSMQALRLHQPSPLVNEVPCPPPPQKTTTTTTTIAKNGVWTRL
jgi:hypothetical protein